MATAKLADVLEAARTLSRAERRRLILELDALVGQEDRGVQPSSEPLAALRALSRFTQEELCKRFTYEGLGEH